jgi:hypothetical protein
MSDEPAKTMPFPKSVLEDLADRHRLCQLVPEILSLAQRVGGLRHLGDLVESLRREREPSS